MEELGLIGDLWVRLDVFLSSKNVSWRIEVTDDRVPFIRVKVFSPSFDTQTSSRYQWMGQIQIDSLLSRRKEDRVYLIQEFVEGIKRKVNEGTPV